MVGAKKCKRQLWHIRGSWEQGKDEIQVELLQGQRKGQFSQ